jgi:hypothetical protein
MTFTLGPKAISAGYGLAAFDQIGSTNAEAMSRARDGERGPTWFVSTEQTAGRGRRQRAWIAPRGNLASSVLEVMDIQPAIAATLGFVAGLALESALQRLSVEANLRRGSDPLKFALKWPNDLVTGGQKLAGILLEAEAVVEGVNTDVARLEADLDTAKFNLDQSTVRAPTDGTVQQNFLRPGMFAASLPLRPVMIFVHDEPPKFVAAFLQNSAQRIEEGSEAEFILPAVPGRFFKGKVNVGGAYISQGQLQPSGNLVDPDLIKGEGRILVAIEPQEDLSKYLIVPGSTAQVAIYTHHMHHLGMLRKVLLRMSSWTNYLFSDGH